MGTKYDLFRWRGPLPKSHFDQITTRPGVVWDTSHLYTDGYVTLTAVPEPSTAVFAACGAGLIAMLALVRRRGTAAKCDARTARAAGNTGAIRRA